jgi:hypothetical protein
VTAPWVDSGPAATKMKDGCGARRKRKLMPAAVGLHVAGSCCDSLCDLYLPSGPARDTRYHDLSFLSAARLQAETALGALPEFDLTS